MVRRGSAWQGRAKLDKMRKFMARQGPVWQDWAGQGKEIQGRVGLGLVW
jgi:hypothetical protein